jgi:hypothetical protein
MAGFGDINIADMANLAGASDMPTEGGDDMTTTEVPDVAAQLAVMDPMQIVDFLKTKKILPEDFEIPEDAEMTSPDMGAEMGYGDMEMPEDESTTMPALITGGV